MLPLLLLSTLASGSASSLNEESSCLSVHQEEHISNTFDHLNHQWISLAESLTDSLSNGGDLSDVSAALDNINDQIQQVKGAVAGKTCINGDGKSMYNRTNELLSTVRTHIDEFTKSKSILKGSYKGSHSKETTKYITDTSSGFGTVKALVRRMVARTVDFVKRSKSSTSKSPAANGVDTNGYQYQGGSVTGYANGYQAPRAGTPNAGYGVAPAAYQPYGYYGYQQGSYPAGYYGYPAYRQPQAPPPPPAREDTSPQNGPHLSDKNGGPIVRFGERLVEVVLYQLEVIGSVFTFGHNSNAISLVKDTQHRVLSLIDKVL